MPNYLFVRGMDPIEIHEPTTLNGIRERVNQAITGTDQKGERAPDNVRNKPLKKLTFKTVVRAEPEEDSEDELGEIVGIGRFAPVPDSIIGVGSDEENDQGERAEDDEEEDE